MLPGGYSVVIRHQNLEFKKNSRADDFGPPRLLAITQWTGFTMSLLAP